MRGVSWPGALLHVEPQLTALHPFADECACGLHCVADATCTESSSVSYPYMRTYQAVARAFARNVVLETNRHRTRLVVRDFQASIEPSDSCDAADSQIRSEKVPHP